MKITKQICTHKLYSKNWSIIKRIHKKLYIKVIHKKKTNKGIFRTLISCLLKLTSGIPFLFLTQFAKFQRHSVTQMCNIALKIHKNKNCKNYS